MTLSCRSRPFGQIAHCAIPCTPWLANVESKHPASKLTMPGRAKTGVVASRCLKVLGSDCPAQSVDKPCSKDQSYSRSAWRMLRPVTRWQVSSCQVLGVIAGSLEGLAHGYQMIAFADWLPFGILYMPDNHQIAQAVELGIVAEHYQGPGDIALDKGFAGIPDYNRHNRSHRDQLAQIMAIHAGANGAKTVHSVQQPIADALPLSNEFQASQELSRLHLGANPGDQPGYAVVDFMIGAIQFLFVVAYRVQGVFGAGFQPRQQSVPRCLSRVTTGLSPLQYLRRGERGKLGGGIGDSGCRRRLLLDCCAGILPATRAALHGRASPADVMLVTGYTGASPPYPSHCGLW